MKTQGCRLKNNSGTDGIKSRESRTLYTSCNLKTVLHVIILVVVCFLSEHLHNCLRNLVEEGRM